MAAVSTIIGAIGVATSIAGTVGGVVAQQQQTRAAKKAEELRKKQMNFEADRERRQAIRQSIIQRSQALTTATNQGAQFGTALPGAFAQIRGDEARNIQGIESNRGIGNALFEQNARIADAQAMGSLFAGISSFGGALTSNAGTLGRLFQFSSRGAV